MLEANKGTKESKTLFAHMKIITQCVLIELVILVVWTAVDPVFFKRECVDNSAILCESIGSCGGNNMTPFVSAIFGLHIFYLLYSLYVCYLARTLPQEFAEHKWITGATVSSLQVLVITPLLALIVWRKTTLLNFILGLSVFLNDITVLCMIFLPKMQLMYFQKDTNQTMVQEDILFNMRRRVRLSDEEEKKQKFLEFPSSGVDKSRRIKSKLRGHVSTKRKDVKAEIDNLRRRIRTLESGISPGPTSQAHTINIGSNGSHLQALSVMKQSPDTARSENRNPLISRNFTTPASSTKHANKLIISPQGIRAEGKRDAKPTGSSSLMDAGTVQSEHINMQRV